MRPLSPVNRVISSPTRALRPPNRMKEKERERSLPLRLRECRTWFCLCFFIRLIRSWVDQTPPSPLKRTWQKRALKEESLMCAMNSSCRELNEKTHHAHPGTSFRIPRVSPDYFCGHVMAHQSSFCSRYKSEEHFSPAKTTTRWHGTLFVFLYYWSSDEFTSLLWREGNLVLPTVDDGFVFFWELGLIRRSVFGVWCFTEADKDISNAN